MWSPEDCIKCFEKIHFVAAQEYLVRESAGRKEALIALRIEERFIPSLPSLVDGPATLIMRSAHIVLDLSRRTKLEHPQEFWFCSRLSIGRLF
jgi:hypothetical protein